MIDLAPRVTSVPTSPNTIKKPTDTMLAVRRARRIRIGAGSSSSLSRPTKYER